MSNLKKILIVFAVLLIFIIIVEQPGSKNIEKDKNIKFFIPNMSMEKIQKVQMKDIGNKKDLTLEIIDGKWQVKNGAFFPADTKRIDDILKALYGLKQGKLVAKNQKNLSIYSVDDKSGVNIQIWNDKGSIANFILGKNIKDGQFIRNLNESMVYESSPGLNPYLQLDTNYWKDRILLSIGVEKVHQIILQSPILELALEKSTENIWNVIKPKKYQADNTTVISLFKELSKLEATSIADETESKKADFKKSNYKISIRMSDNSLKSVMFKAIDKENKKYYAKNGGTDYIYIVSSDLINNIFGLKFENSKN